MPDAFVRLKTVGRAIYALISLAVVRHAACRRRDATSRVYARPRRF